MATLKNLTINDTGNLRLPTGTTAQRSAVAGTIRYNTSLALFEGFDGTNWTPLHTMAAGTTTTYTSTPGPGVHPIPPGVTHVNALIVAGGGGGGLCMGGGGGGGGVRYISNIPVTPGGTVPVAVGAGGAGGTGRGGSGSRGGSSNFGPYISTGGGGGANWDGGTGQPGGSGGGGSQSGGGGGTGNTPSVTPPQGFPGGSQAVMEVMPPAAVAVVQVVVECQAGVKLPVTAVLE